MVSLLLEAAFASTKEFRLQKPGTEQDKENIITHSCIHDQIIEQRKRPGHKVYSVSAQVYNEPGVSESLQRRGRALLGLSESSRQQNDAKQPIRIFLNYDAVGHSSDRDCRSVGDIVKASTCNGNEQFSCAIKSHLRINIVLFSFHFLCQLGEPTGASFSGTRSCNPNGDPPIYGDCWYNCTLDDIAGEDKKYRLRKVFPT